jgi:hypothetical protein
MSAWLVRSQRERERGGGREGGRERERERERDLLGTLCHFAQRGV